MPIDSIQDAVAKVEEEKALPPIPVEEAPAPSNHIPWQIPGFLTADTGPGEIEDYLDHPLNWRKARWVARVLRGLTGMFGNLKKAVIDVFLGVLESVERNGQNTTRS